MILNRVGDFGLVIGILIIFVEYKAVDYAAVFSITPILTNKVFSFLSFDFDLISIICFFLFVGAVGKSAQLGLHT
jgi:NADH:ubiquinone oxidoreductase subunit 5 (subunit L)/multisubunit Na+/H+ antiporter MnhA subunit